MTNVSPSQSLTDRYATRFHATVAALAPSLLPQDFVFAGQLRDMRGLAARGRIDDYSAEVFADPAIRRNLERIEDGLRHRAKPLSPAELAVLQAGVAELLLGTALRPVRERTHRDLSTFGASTLVEREIIPTLSRTELAEALGAIAGQAAMGDPLRQFTAVGYQPGQPVAERITRLGALNLMPGAQAELVNDPLFARMVASPIAIDLLFRDDYSPQEYLNTCPISTLNSAEVFSKVPAGPLGVVQVCRRTVQHLSDDLMQADPKILLQVDKKSLFGDGQTIGQRITKHVASASMLQEDVTRKLERLLDAADLGEVRPGDETTQAKVRQWTRQLDKMMQATANNANFNLGIEALPEPYEKVVPGMWGVSALVQTVTAGAPDVIAGLLRGDGLAAVSRAVLGGDGEKWLELLSEQIKTDSVLDTDGSKVAVSDQAAADPTWLPAFWERVQQDGKIPMFGPTHAMALTATERDGIRYFGVNDPKVNGTKLIPLQPPEAFVKWARATSITVAATYAHHLAKLAIEPAKPPVQTNIAEMQQTVGGVIDNQRRVAGPLLAQAAARRLIAERQGPNRIEPLSPFE